MLKHIDASALEAACAAVTIWLEKAGENERVLALEALQVAVVATNEAAMMTGVLPLDPPSFSADEPSSRSTTSATSLRAPDPPARAGPRADRAGPGACPRRSTAAGQHELRWARPIPDGNVVAVADFLLLHGNGADRSGPDRRPWSTRTRAVAGYRPMPILFNEDDHFDFELPSNNFVAAIGRRRLVGLLRPRQRCRWRRRAGGLRRGLPARAGQLGHQHRAQAGLLRSGARDHRELMARTTAFARSSRISMARGTGSRMRRGRRRRRSASRHTRRRRPAAPSWPGPRSPGAR